MTAHASDSALYSMPAATGHNEPASGAQDDIAATTVLPSSRSPNPNPEEDEASIQQYMSQLLERVNGGTAASPSPAVTQPLPPVAPQTRTPAATPAQPAAAEPSPPPARQPARAPESTVTLSDMRELANLSARRAVGTHECKRLIDTARRDVRNSMIASVVSCGMVWLAPAAGSLLYLGAAGVSLLAVTYGLRFLNNLRKLARAAKETNQPVAAEPTPVTQ